MRRLSLLLALLLVFLAASVCGMRQSPPPRPIAEVLRDADELLAQAHAPSTHRALETYAEAAARSHHLGRHEEFAVALLGMGKAWKQSGRTRLGRFMLEKASEAGRDLPGSTVEIDALNELPLVLLRLGLAELAEQRAEQALLQSRASSYLRGECEALNNLAIIARNRLELGKAWRYYALALDGWRQIGDATGRASVLHNLGILLTQLDLLPEAVDVLEQAVELHASEGNGRHRAESLTALAWAHHWGPSPQAALPFYEQALHGFRTLQDARGEAVLLDRRARTLLKLGHGVEARRVGEKALSMFRAFGERRSRAAILCNLARALVAEGAYPEALDRLRQSRELLEEGETPGSWAETWHLQAKAERGLQRFEQAIASSEKAIGLVEDMHLGALTSSARASYLSTLQDYFGAYIDTLIETAGRRPGEGFEARILEVGERQRARGLLFDIAHSEVALGRAAQRRDYQHHRELLQRIRSLERDRQARLDTREQLRALREQRALLLKVEELGIRELAHSEPFPMPRSLSGAEIRSRVLDADTVALVFTFGERRSYVNVVTQRLVAGFELAPRAQIEKAVSRVLGNLRKSWVEREALVAREGGHDLSVSLFGPVERFLRRPRILFVADGELQRLPLAALPLPTDSSEPLVARFEVVGAPSLSVLAALRQRALERPSPQRSMAVFADPVFSERDSRFTRQPQGAMPSGGRSGARQNSPTFGRLAGAREEAAAILELASTRAESRSFTGFAATREAVLGGGLGEFRWIHFATHAVQHPEHPELAALVLSQVDENAEPVEGMLFVNDLASLELSTDLVVLSACDTGGGQLVRGEGVIGLARGFLEAGASQVLVSHWRIHDEATAVLMGQFYRRLIIDGLPPAQALREAQRWMRESSDWSSPYYWAGFSLLGSWETKSTEASTGGRSSVS